MRWSFVTNRYNYNMKKSFFSIFALIAFTCQVQASNVVIDYQGDTVVRQKNVERNLIIKSDDGGVYDIAIKPVNDVLEGVVSIPLENVFINNTVEDVYLRYKEYSNLFTNLSVPMNVIAKIRDYGMVPAGDYVLPFEIQATNIDTQEITTVPFTLQFIVPVVQEIDLNGEVPKITVNATDAFDTQKRITNEVTPTIKINSNTNWTLSINSDNFGTTKGNYYIRTISATSNVTERLQERVLLEPNREIIIAKGTAPADNESVVVEFSMASADGKFIPAGNYENRVKYILREEGRWRKRF